MIRDLVHSIIRRHRRELLTPLHLPRCKTVAVCGYIDLYAPAQSNTHTYRHCDFSFDRFHELNITLRVSLFVFSCSLRFDVFFLSLSPFSSTSYSQSGRNRRHHHDDHHHQVARFCTSFYPYMRQTDTYTLFLSLGTRFYIYQTHAVHTNTIYTLIVLLHVRKRKGAQRTMRSSSVSV